MLQIIRTFEALSEDNSNARYYAFALCAVLLVALVLRDWFIKYRGRHPLTQKQQVKYFLLFMTAVLLTAIGFSHLPLMIASASVIAVTFLSIRIQPVTEEATPVDDSNIFTVPEKTAGPGCLIYSGRNLNISDEVIVFILDKYLPFYSRLPAAGKPIFLSRIKQFMRNKTFEIYDTAGFREMPVLVSAAAIRVSFGLSNFMLPSFKTIRIYPEEFMRLAPGISFLIGNVSNGCINISWKHFMKGFQFPDNGENVGLHEMAHAYYYQNVEGGTDISRPFISGLAKWDTCCGQALSAEKAAAEKFYTDYGLTNPQEFWAESIEHFFERPLHMKQKYPELYQSLCCVLNCDLLQQEDETYHHA